QPAGAQPAGAQPADARPARVVVVIAVSGRPPAPDPRQPDPRQPVLGQPDLRKPVLGQPDLREPVLGPRDPVPGRPAFLGGSEVMPQRAAWFGRLFGDLRRAGMDVVVAAMGEDGASAPRHLYGPGTASVPGGPEVAALVAGRRSAACGD